MIKIYNKKESTTQNIYLFSEDDWEQEKNSHPNVELFFNGKKNEVFIKTNPDEISFFIGIGKD